MAHTVALGDRGRIVLPAPIRDQLNLKAGDKFVIRVEEDGSIRLDSFRAIAERNRGIFAHLVSPGRSLVDELIAERRAEAARESAD